MADPNASMYQLNADSSFHFEILRALSLSVYDGSDIAEVLTAANNIIPANFESFCSAFTALAENVFSRALRILSNKLGSKFASISARTALFSAATYFRSADFYLHGNVSDPRIMSLWASQTQAFDQGLALMEYPARRLTIPTPEFDIPAIWISPSQPTEHVDAKQVAKRPTLVLGNGYDGCQEEMLHAVGLAALERGYNVLTYDGPGQPSVRRYQGIGFIPEWERVVTPVVDYLFQHADEDGVDTGAIGLLGLSFGGYLAPRAAAFEHRLAAVMAIDGVYDFGQVARASLGPDLMKLFDAGDRAQFDKVVMNLTLPGNPTGIRWSIQQGMWAFAADSPFDFVAQMMRYTLRDVARKITTPTFVGAAEADMFFPGQPEELAKALGKWGLLYNFTDADYIGTHSGIGALKQQNAVILDWFQGVLDSKHESIQ
ncbi:hypothetical protein ESCO_002023 [Escovopsis weberi]|uniref:AB hydrolase-1 domain-containing protein n=1 Tax=Escovopsis weberi TaxID=150374 RepID=A0A0M9VWQ6_ESCWE|nr:hypothetical protein ESCO_002023 [Escovopsis weberi]